MSDGDGAAVDNKPDLKEKAEPSVSPWAAAARGDAKTRVVGWKNGVSLTTSEVNKVLKTDKDARHAYKVAKEQRQRIDGPAHEKHSVDPLLGMPAAFAAFWGSVPHLDAKDHVKHFKREQKKQSSDRKEPEDDEEHAGFASIEEECAELESELTKLKENVRAKEKLSAEWEIKLQKLRREQIENEETVKSKKRRIDLQTYQKGILKGKINSSDKYFGFIYDDLTDQHKRELMTLSRACSLMESSMTLEKNEMRELLRVANEENRLSDKVSESGRSSR